MFEQIAATVSGSLLLSALCAALPLIVLFALLTAVTLALVVWRMPVGQGQTLGAATEGFVYGLIPILWILVNALWIYKMTVATSWFDVLGRTIRSISNGGVPPKFAGRSVDAPEAVQGCPRRQVQRYEPSSFLE